MKKHFLVTCMIAGVLLIITACESKPVSVELGDNGYQTTSFLMLSDSTRTIQDESGTAKSSRLVLGPIDSARVSTVLLKLNPEVMAAHPDICVLPSDSIFYGTTFIRLKSVERLTENPGAGISDSTRLPGIFDGDRPEDMGFPGKIRAFWVDFSSIDFQWDEETTFLFQEDGSILLGDTPIDPDYLENILDASELKVYLNGFNVDIYLAPVDEWGIGDSVFVPIVSDLCDPDGNFGIFLRAEQTDSLIQLYSTNYTFLSNQPILDLEYQKYQAQSFQVNKFTIENIIPLAFDPAGYQAVLDTTADNWGTVIAMNFDPDDSTVWDSGNIPENAVEEIGSVNEDFELLQFIIQPTDLFADSSGQITFYFSNTLLASMDLDPSNDNYSADNPDGPDGNSQYDEGELFFDCGLDAVCDEDEDGYFPDGTEGNGFRDDGELFSDTGIDSLYSWEEEGYDPDTNPDPVGDDYNIDPEGDDWRDCGADGLCEGDDGYPGADEGELNEIWDPGEGLENNGRYDENELYWDYGLDGLEDVNEPGYDPETNSDPNGDNWSPDNPDGTENNGLFDWIDLNEDGIQDEGEHEVFKDAGIDTLWSINETGYNPYGAEGNGQYDSGEPFDDCGIDNICGEIPDIDDFIPDPAGDNWTVTDSTGTENNGILDWNDDNGNGVWDEGEGEQWFDWGLDMTRNEMEPYYGGRRLIIPSFTDFFEWDMINEPEAVFDKPAIDTETGEEAVIWVSSVAPLESGGEYLVTVSAFSTEPVHGFQFRLNHIPFSYTDTTLKEINSVIRYIDNEKLILDASLYDRHVYDDNLLSDICLVNYGDNLSTFLEFSQVTDFLEEHPEAIISRADLTVYIDTSATQLSEDAFVDFQRLLEYPLLPVDTLSVTTLSVVTVQEENDGVLAIDVKGYMQNLVSGEYPYRGLLLGGQSLGYNFSTIRFYGHEAPDSLKPKLEVMFSE